MKRAEKRGVKALAGREFGRREVGPVEAGLALPPKGTEARRRYDRLVKAPVFTHEELRAIHHDLHGLPWLPKAFYNERNAVLVKLKAYFGEDLAHLKVKNL